MHATVARLHLNWTQYKGSIKSNLKPANTIWTSESTQPAFEVYSRSLMLSDEWNKTTKDGIEYTESGREKDEGVGIN